MDNKFLIVVFVIIAGFIGFLGVSKQSKQTDTSNVTVSPSSHIQGAGTSGVELIEYGDFQCPACAAYYPVVKAIKEKYGDQIKFQFRHFPLVQIHNHALLASKAAEAASRQGKFWEMHDLLYENQRNWSVLGDPTDTFVGYATQLNLDVEQFRADITNKEVNDIVLADLKQAQALGATSTPTFVLNGERLTENPDSLDAFYELIDSKLQTQDQENTE